MITLIVLAIVLIIFSVWNLISLSDLKKHNRSYLGLKDDKYYELKYKIEYITTIAIVVISVGGFFGYKWFEEIKNKSSELKAVIDAYDYKLDSIGDRIESKKYSLNEYEAIQNSIEKRIEASEDTLIKLSKRINVINSKNIIKQDFFIVENLKIPIGGVMGEKPGFTFYFKDLKTLSGDKLPTFKRPPFLVIVPENPVDLTLIHIDKESFKVDCPSYLTTDDLPGYETDSAKFSIMLSQK